MSQRPFSNGSEYRSWVDRNCKNGCLYYSGPDDYPTCALDLALTTAYMGDGTVKPDIAERLGCNTTELGYPAADCPEKLT